MHENAAVQHDKNKWIGKVRRAPDGDERAGAFFRNDTQSFYVVWEIARCARCQRVADVPTEPCGPDCPQSGWIQARQIRRVV
jgi:hypothetical protein